MHSSRSRKIAFSGRRTAIDELLIERRSPCQICNQLAFLTSHAPKTKLETTWLFAPPVSRFTVNKKAQTTGDGALPGRPRRGRCACPPPPLASRAHRGLWAHRGPLRARVCLWCRAGAFKLHFADRLRAGTGRRSGSGRRPGRVRWGRPLLSRPRGAVGSGPAAVLAAVDSAAELRPSRRRAGVSLGLDGCEVRLCDPCARLCPCVLCVPCVSRLPPVVSFYR